MSAAVKKKKKQQSAKPSHADPLFNLPESLYIPQFLRSDIDEKYRQTYALHTANMAISSIGTVRSPYMIDGIMKHQERVSDERSKLIPVDEVIDISISERRDREGFFLGKKVELSFYSGNSDGDKEESITTNWIDYYGFWKRNAVGPNGIFEVSLARSVAACACALRDADVNFHIRKGFGEVTTNKRGDPINPREMIDVIVRNDAEFKAAIIAQNLDALIIAIEKDCSAALNYIEDSDLMDIYEERAFGFV